MMVIQVPRYILVEFLSEKLVRISGDATNFSTSHITLGDEIRINYEALFEPSEAVAGAIEGALALEGKNT